MGSDCSCGHIQGIVCYVVQVHKQPSKQVKPTMAGMVQCWKDPVTGQIYEGEFATRSVISCDF